MKVRIVIGLILAVTVGLGLYLLRSTFNGQSSPNVVLIIVDTLRADKLGIYGNPSPASAEFDKIASKGIVFENAISQASWTRSSVASLLSGLYPKKTSVLKEKWDALPSSVITLAEYLKARDYFTIGLTANPQLNRDFNFQQGFDHYSESTILFQWMRPSDGKVKADKTSPIRSGEEMFKESYRLAQKHQGRSPLYMQILIMDVHSHHRILSEDIDGDIKPFSNASYLQAVRQATQPLSKFIRKMDKLLGGNVVFFVVADHGEGLSDHPAVSNSKLHGNLLYRSQVHVPFVVIEGKTSRRFRPGRRSQLTQLVQIVPTVLDIVGDKQPASSFDGHSLFPNLQDPKTPIVTDKVFTQTEWRPGVKKAAVVTPEWFYIESEDAWPGTGPEELHRFNGPQNGLSDSLHLANDGIVKRLREDVRRFTSK